MVLSLHNCYGDGQRGHLDTRYLPDKAVSCLVEELRGEIFVFKKTESALSKILFAQYHFHNV